MAAQAQPVGLTGGCQCGGARRRIDDVPDQPFPTFGNWFVPAHLGNRRRPDPGA
jgi:hypothetical protein